MSRCDVCADITHLRAYPIGFRESRLNSCLHPVVQFLQRDSLPLPFVNVCLRWYYSPWRPSFRFNAAPLKKMFPFSIKLLLTGIFNVINDNIFALILGISYSKAQAGFYAQGRKWSYMAYSTVWGMANNVSQAVLAQVADTADRQQNVFRKLIRFMAYVTFPSMLGLAFISEEFIAITVGEKWLPSIPYMQLFCLWAIVTPLNNICTNTIISRGKSNIYMYGTITLDVVQLLVIYFSAPLGVFQMVINYVITCFEKPFSIYRKCQTIKLPVNAYDYLITPGRPGQPHAFHRIGRIAGKKTQQPPARHLDKGCGTKLRIQRTVS